MSFYIVEYQKRAFQKIHRLQIREVLGDQVAVKWLEVQREQPVAAVAVEVVAVVSKTYLWTEIFCEIKECFL